MASPVREARLLHDSRGFTERFERGRGHLISRNPSTGQKAFTGQIGGAGWHTEALTEIDSDWVAGQSPVDDPWLWVQKSADYHAYFAPGNDTFDSGQIIKYVHPASGEEVTFEATQLQWTNDLNQLQAIGDPANVSPTITGDKIRYDNAFGTGLHFEWECQTARLAKKLHIDARPTAPNSTIIAGGNPVLKLSFIFQKSSGVEIWIDGVLWDEKSNNPQASSGDVEFRLTSTGEVLWLFKRPWAKDGIGEAPNVVARYRAQAQNLFVDVLVPWSWMDTADYPMEIDPTYDSNVGSSADDAYERADDASFTYTNTQLNHKSNTAASDRYVSGMRWPSTGIAFENTIDVAYCTTKYDHNARDNVNVDIYGEAVASAADYSTTQDVINRTLTTATVADPSGLGYTNVGKDVPHQSPSLVSIIQEIVDITSFNGVINLFYWGDTDEASGNCTAYSYDASTTNCPILHVEYTTSTTENLSFVTGARNLGATAAGAATAAPSFSVAKYLAVTAAGAATAAGAFTTLINAGLTADNEVDITLAFVTGARDLGVTFDGSQLITADFSLAESLGLTAADVVTASATFNTLINAGLDPSAIATAGVAFSTALQHSLASASTAEVNKSFTQLVNLALTATGSQASFGDFSLAESLGLTAAGAADAAASFSQLVSLAVTSAGAASTDQALNLALSEGLDLSSAATAAATFTLADLLALTAAGSQVIDGSFTLSDILTAAIEGSQAIGGSFSLADSLGLTAADQVTAAGLVDQALNLDLSTASQATAAATWTELVSLATTITVVADTSAAYQLAHNLLLVPVDAQATAALSLALLRVLTADFTATVDSGATDGSFSLSLSHGVDAAGGAAVVSAVTLTHSQFVSIVGAAAANVSFDVATVMMVTVDGYTFLLADVIPTPDGPDDRVAIYVKRRKTWIYIGSSKSWTSL